MSDRIRVQVGVTRNLGDFNSLRLDAAIETDVRTGETVDEAFERAWAKADEQVDAKLNEED